MFLFRFVHIFAAALSKICYNFIWISVPLVSLPSGNTRAELLEGAMRLSFGCEAMRCLSGTGGGMMTISDYGNFIARHHLLLSETLNECLCDLLRQTRLCLVNIWQKDSVFYSFGFEPRTFK